MPAYTKKLLVPLYLLLFFLPEVSGQLWMRERQFVFFGMGASGFMGDLGGADKIGKQDFRDFDFKAIRPATKIGYRYFVNYDLAVTGNLAFGYVSGDDRHTQETFRKTFTDYLDDASTTYVDPAVYAANWEGNPSRIALGEYFSNPTNYSIQNVMPGYRDPTQPGDQRANPHNNDAYMFLFFTVQYKIITGPTQRRWAPLIR